MDGKLKAAGVLVLMYGLGIASGVAWEMHEARHRPPHQMFGERRIARLKKELKLSTWQEQTLREIVQDARDRANDIHDAVDYDLAQIRADSIEQIQHLLNPEQREQFEALRARMHRKHRAPEASEPPKSAPEGEAPTALQSANQDVQNAQMRVHSERTNYLNAVQASGQDSAQARAAKTRLDASRQDWRGKMEHRQSVRHQARRELMHHRDARHPHP